MWESYQSRGATAGPEQVLMTMTILVRLREVRNDPVRFVVHVGSLVRGG